MKPLSKTQLWMEPEPQGSLFKYPQPNGQGYDIFHELREIQGEIVEAAIHFPDSGSGDGEYRMTVEITIVEKGKTEPTRYGLKFMYEGVPVRILCKIGNNDFQFTWNGYAPMSFDLFRKDNNRWQSEK